jgi:hypothetical protein
MTGPLVGFFDESGLDERSLSFWVAGYVGFPSDWYEFSRRWNHALKSHGVTTLHTTELLHSKGEFKGWTPEQKRACLADLISVVDGSNLLGVGGGVVREVYKRLVVDSGFLEEVGLKPEWWREPYLLAFQHCIVEAVRMVTVLPKRTVINFIFEEQSVYASRCKFVFSGLSDTRVWPRGDWLGSVEFAPPSKYTPLQLADLLAYELRKALDNKLADPGKEIRRSLERLRSRLISSPYVDEEAMTRFMEEVRQRGRIDSDASA